MKRNIISSFEVIYEKFSERFKVCLFNENHVVMVLLPGQSNLLLPFKKKKDEKKIHIQDKGSVFAKMLCFISYFERKKL